MGRRLLLPLLLLHMASCTDIRICDTTNAALASPPPAYTAYIRFLYSAGLSAESLTMPDNCDQYNGVNTLFNGWGKIYGLNTNADVGGVHAHCNSIYNNIQNAAKGVGLTVHWPPTLPTTYQDYSNPPPSYTSQVINLIYDLTIRHDFVAKTLRTTAWTSVYLQRPSQYDNDNEVLLSHQISKQPPKACLAGAPPVPASTSSFQSAHPVFTGIMLGPKMVE